MTDQTPKRDARSLVEAALSQSQPSPEADAAPAEPAAPVAPPDGDDVAAMIEAYFDVESPGERDVLFDRLTTIQHPQVDEFLRAMMTADEDEYMRAAATAELARRGDQPALRSLEGDLEDPDDPCFFEQALEVLAQVRGAAFYETVLALWRDTERDLDQRRQAMVVMEAIDAGRAMADFSADIESMTDVATLPDDLLEAAMVAFARNDYRQAEPHLEALRDRVLAAGLDDEERAELAGAIQEGLDLLRSQR